MLYSRSQQVRSRVDEERKGKREKEWEKSSGNKGKGSEPDKHRVCVCVCLRENEHTKRNDGNLEVRAPDVGKKDELCGRATLTLREKSRDFKLFPSEYSHKWI